MEAIGLAAAKDRLSELVARVEAGETFEITRRGRPVARLTPIPATRKRVDREMLLALTEAVPEQTEGPDHLLRSMRGSDRY